MYIPIQVIDRKRKIDLMGLEQGVQSLGRRQPEQPTQFPLREPPQPKFFDRQGFKHASRQVAGSPKPVREIIGNVNGYIHAFILPGRRSIVKNTAIFG